MARVLYLISHYPQLSETYIETERREVETRAETFLISNGPPDCPTPEHLSFKCVPKNSRVATIWSAWRFRPDVVHTHWLHMAKNASYVARKTRVPWTIRTHSFDILERSLEQIKGHIGYCNEEDCRAVFAFPFQRTRLLEAGLKEEKIIDTMPVVNTSSFPFSDHHGSSIINMGALKPKKMFEDYIYLLKLRPDLNFRLYPMGSTKNIDGLRQLASQQGGKIEISDPVVFSKMPEIWKEHRWLVYTADRKLKSVGWPMSVVEAWASGTGVCIPRIRPDIEQYVGDAAIVYDDIKEVADLIGEPPNAELLESGKRRAAEMDIKRWIHPLYEIWRQAGVAI